METLTYKTKKIFKMKALYMGISIAFLLGACGDNKYGIDYDKLTVPVCSADSNDTSAAILVAADTTLVATEEGTTYRVWHYENSDKYVCVITGAAKLVEN